MNFSPAHPRSLDEVLRLNQTAISHISLVLSCPCSLDDNFALLIAQVAAKVLAWYQAILDDSEDPDMNAMRVKVLPIKIGQYEPDLKEHGKMVAQMVVIDLAKVGKLVENFAQRYCGGERQRGGEIEQPLYVSLESLLRKKLNDTLGMTASKLNGEPA